MVLFRFRVCLLWMVRFVKHNASHGTLLKSLHNMRKADAGGGADGTLTSIERGLILTVRDITVVERVVKNMQRIHRLAPSAFDDAILG